MNEIQRWLLTMQHFLTGDFIGIAMNVASANQPKEIRWLYAIGNLSESYQTIRLQVNHGVAGIVWKTARLQIDERIDGYPQKMIDYPIARLEKLMSVAAAPVISQKQVSAVLLLGMRTPYKFTEKELRRLLIAAAQLAPKIEEYQND
ncbi:GAF domain-containing protein [Enterococcus faecalis]